MKTISHFQSIFSAWLALFMTAFTFTASSQNEKLDYSTADKDLETAKATVQAYEAQDWQKLKTYLAQDATIYGLASFDSLNVEQTIAYWTKGSETASPELQKKSWLNISYPEGPKAGNWVYHWGENTLRYSNGETITFPYHLALQIEAGKVQEAHFYYDNMKIIRAMGYAISPPLEEEEVLEEGLEGNLEIPGNQK